MNEMWSRCREARHRTKKTQAELATDLGVTTGAVSQWEMRKGTSPTVPNMIKLARVSGMMFEYLATGRGPKWFGPAVEEPDEAVYRVEAETPQEREVLSIMRAMRAAKRAALLEILRPER